LAYNLSDMNITRFEQVAKAADCHLMVADALPYGGFGEMRPLALYVGLAEDYATYQREAGRACTYWEAMDEVLETSAVLAVCNWNKKVIGAWCATGWHLGSIPMTTDEAYKRLFIA